MNYSLETQLKMLNDAIHKASRFMLRDFHEISQLQSSKKGLKDFTHKSYLRLQNKLTTELKEIRPQYDVILSNQVKPSSEFFFVIDPISGITNFQRGIPFCCIAVGLFKNNEPLAISIFNPILREIFYAAKMLGAWLENYNESIAPKSRMRVSNICDMSDAIISNSYSDILCNQNRILGSSLLEMAYLAAGRFDLIIDTSESLLTQAGMMMIREAGGFTKEKNNIIIASNEGLAKQANELFNSTITS